jgi:hypothetical protein
MRRKGKGVSNCEVVQMSFEPLILVSKKAIDLEN